MVNDEVKMSFIFIGERSEAKVHIGEVQAFLRLKPQTLRASLLKASNKALLRLPNDLATQFSVVERNAISDFQPPENFGNGAARAEPRVCQCRLLPQKKLVADE